VRRRVFIGLYFYLTLTPKATSAVAFLYAKNWDLWGESAWGNFLKKVPPHPFKNFPKIKSEANGGRTAPFQTIATAAAAAPIPGRLPKS
jgi:hypothetical protein